MTNELERTEKEVAYYSASINAWFTTRLEHDKSLLTLSAGGVGILVTLLSTVGMSSTEGLFLYVSALLSFIVCLGCVLWIFKRNATYLQNEISEPGANDSLLSVLDATANYSFFMAVVFTSLIGLSTAINTYIEREVSMNKNKPNTQQQTLIENFNGVSKLRHDSEEVEKSFNGSGGLRPQPKPEPSKDSGNKESGNKESGNKESGKT